MHSRHLHARHLHSRHLLLALFAALPMGAFAESDSPWLPIPGKLSLGLNHTEQSGSDAYIGSTLLPLTAITGGAASKYQRSSTTLRVDYGFSDALALDATIGRAKVKVGAADNDSGSTDTTLGLRWRVLDEYENPSVPTLTLRAGAIFKGGYEGARLASIGKGTNGFEVAVVLGKQLTPAVAVWGELGVQDRSGNVPNANFFELGTRLRFAPQWNASVGYGNKKFGGNLEIGGPGFSPARFQEVREERSVLKLGVGYAFAANQGVALNLAKATAGRNTVKDNQVIGLSYAFAF